MEVFALILLILAAIFYFIPTGIAKQLEAKNFGSIFSSTSFSAGPSFGWIGCAALGDQGGAGRIPPRAAIVR